EGVERGERRRVLPLLRLLADLARPQAERGVHRVEERRLPYARRPGHHARLAEERGAEGAHALARHGAREQDGVAEPRVEVLPEGEGLLRARLPREEVRLVDDEAGVEVVRLGHDEEAVYEAGVELRLERRLHAPRRVHVGRDHVLLADAAAGGAAAELV